MGERVRKTYVLKVVFSDDLSENAFEEDIADYFADLRGNFGVEAVWAETKKEVWNVQTNTWTPTVPF